MTNFDKLNDLFAHAQLHNSVNKALNTKRNITHDIKRDKLVEFRRIVFWMSGKHY